MADSDDSVGSWPAFVAQINNTFNLLRDIFGYAMPGGVFIATGLVSGQVSLSKVNDLLSPYHPPTWAFVILVVGACYIIGDVMAATAYMPISVGKWIVWEGKRWRRFVRPWVREWKWLEKCAGLRNFLKWLDKQLTAWLKPWLEENPTEASAALLEIRQRRKGLLSTIDRRETLTILAGSTAVALLGGWYVFFFAKWDAKTICFWTGLILIVQFCTGITHLRRVAENTRIADAELTKQEKSQPAAAAGVKKQMDTLLGAANDAVAAAKKLNAG